MASTFNYLFEFYEEEILNGIIPELYIDNEILTKEKKYFKENNHKVYKINGDLFYEDHRNQNDLQEFCIELKNQNEDNEDWSFEIKQNSFVVMINSILLLSCYQWNTITDEYPPKCLVCDLIIPDPSSHTKKEDHVANLEKHKPLKKFNLHITRLIGDQYHCAVCNEVYEKNNNTHLDTERHLERMLYATNSATISVYDFDVNNDNRSVNNDNDRQKDTVSTSESGFDSDGFYDLNNVNNNKSTIKSYASAVKPSITEASTSSVEHIIGNKTFNIESDIYHMILRQSGKNLFYCMLCIRFDDLNNTSDHCMSEEHLKKLLQCEIMDIHDDHFIRKVTNKFYHCGTCNNLLLTGAVESHLELHEKKHENKTNKNNDKGNKQDNKCHENSTEGNVQENKISESSDRRNVQENKINENRDKENVQENKTNVNNKVFEIYDQRTQRAHLNVHPTAPLINNINPNIYNDIIVNRFNCNIRVSFMSYNLIIRRVVDFICLLCNFVSSDMTLHLKDPRHILCLENFPFQPYFGINLVRIFHQYAHCAICNVLVNAAVIHLHTTSQPHLFLLNRALNPNNLNIAMDQTTINSMQSVNTKQPTDVNVVSSSENLQAIPTSNAKISNQESATEATVIQTIDLNHTELDTDNLEFDMEDNLDILKEFVYLKIKKSLVKVSYCAYNTLVHTGDGYRYCFICSYKITNSLRGHIKSKAHMNRMKKCKFITNYEKDLLRQVKLTYHCCICNVLVQKSEIRNHVIWPVHKENSYFLKLRKHANKDNIINAEFQTKDMCVNEKEPQIQIVFKFIFGKKTKDNIGGMVINIPPNKEYRGKIFNISWDAWQGITRHDHGVFCNICNDFFRDIDSHLEEDIHKKIVSTPIEKQYLPVCIRKITKETLNCVTCNMVFPNKERIISQHIAGKKHLENYKVILKTVFTDALLS